MKKLQKANIVLFNNVEGVALQREELVQVRGGLIFTAAALGAFFGFVIKSAAGGAIAGAASFGVKKGIDAIIG